MLQTITDESPMMGTSVKQSRSSVNAGDTLSDDAMDGMFAMSPPGGSNGMQVEERVIRNSKRSDPEDDLDLYVTFYYT